MAGGEGKDEEEKESRQLLIVVKHKSEWAVGCRQQYEYDIKKATYSYEYVFHDIFFIGRQVDLNARRNDGMVVSYFFIIKNLS